MEQTDTALSNNFHHILPNTAMAMEIHENQTINRDDVSMDDISTCSSTMDLDGDDKTSDPTWMPMSRLKRSGCAKSKISKTLRSICLK